VGTAGRIALRVIRPAREKYGVGDDVFLTIPATSCRLVDADETRGDNGVDVSPQGATERRS